ncbi:MAG: hypothetical protein N2691_05870 [Patescibacteria group bacterium]|nr:hypothetical protein [Patescibacteria group bacterium]
MSQQPLPAHTAELDSICTHLYERSFAQMERCLVSLVETLVAASADSVRPGEKSYTVYILLYSFNQYYIRWLERHGYAVKKECEDLNSLEHDSYLLAYCQNVHAMEALLKQLWVSFNQPPQKVPVDSAVQWYRDRYIG